MKAFLKETDSARKAIALETLLRAPTETGIDCLAVPFMVVKAACTWTGQRPDWLQTADKNYITVLQPGNRRIEADKDVAYRSEAQRLAIVQGMTAQGRSKKDIAAANRYLLKQLVQVRKAAEESLVKTKDAGITMMYQPAAVQESWMEASSRPTNRYKPNFEYRPQDGEQMLPLPVQEALSHGIPFSGGLSGSTNIMLHLVSYVREQGMDIDIKDVLLATMMMTNFDGGHSPHECMWVASQLDGNGEGKLPLNLRLGDPSLPPEQFVADYTRLFDDGTGSAAAPDPVRVASEKAFEATVAYFRENSFYASPNDRPREP